MAEKLEFDLSVKSNDLKKALEQANQAASSLHSYYAGGVQPAIAEAAKATEDINQKMSDFTTTTLGVAAGQFAFSVLQRAISFVTSSITESIGAFADQEDATNKLKQAFILTGGASEAALEGINAFATGLEKVSKFSDDSIIKQVAFVKSLGATTANSKELVLAAANLSAVLGGSLEENTEKLGKTLSGTAGRLAQFIPELKSLTKAQLEAGEAATIINNKFGGSAANDLNTYRGQTAQLANAFNNLQETMGELIVKSKPYQIFLATAKGYIDDLNASTNANIAINKIAADGYKVTGQTLNQVTTDSKALAIQIASLNKELQQAEDMDGYGAMPQNTSSLTAQILQLTQAKKLLDEQIAKGPTTFLPEAEDKKAPKIYSDAEVQEKIKRQAEITALDLQFQEANKAIDEQYQNSKITNELDRSNAELERLYEFEARKADITAQLKLTEAASKLEGTALASEKEKIEAERKLAIIESYGKKELASQAAIMKSKQANETIMLAYEKKIETDKLKDKEAFFAAATSLQSSSNRELATIGKAFAIQQATINGYAAIQSSFRFGSEVGGPLTGVAFAAIAAAATAANVAKIAGVAFENGGVVGGFTGGSVGADNRVAKIRDGEMILNAEDQKKLFDGIKSGNFGGGQIVVQIDGRNIASAVRDQIQSGFVLA